VDAITELQAKIRAFLDSVQGAGAAMPGIEIWINEANDTARDFRMWREEMGWDK
jgi:hypothetical protein